MNDNTFICIRFCLCVSSLYDTDVGIVSIYLYPRYIRTSLVITENGSTLFYINKQKQPRKPVAKYGALVAL